MSLNREQISQIVMQTLREMGEDLEIPELETADETTRLFGARSALDSMNLVNFIADVEEKISDEFDIDIILANQSAMSQSYSPFRKVSTCIDYILELVTGEPVS